MGCFLRGQCGWWSWLGAGVDHDVSCVQRCVPGLMDGARWSDRVMVVSIDACRQPHDPVFGGNSDGSWCPVYTYTPYVYM